MVSEVQFLLDSSALGKSRHPSVDAQLQPMRLRGLLATCPVLDLEAGYTAKDAADFDRIMQDRALAYIPVLVPDNVFDRVREIQFGLVHSGIHRGVGIVDMIIAATAASNDLTVLHYDHDFSLIADVFEFEHQWVVPQGSVD